MIINVGIIGTGVHGSRYAEHIITDVPALKLVAICRRSKNGVQQAEKWHTTLYQNWRELIRSQKVEAVISVLPPAMNQQIARECVIAGKPLLIEKPLAIDTKSALEIVSMFNKAKLPLTTGQTLRYHPVICGLKAEITRVGRLFSFSASHHIEPVHQSWIDDPKLAGGGVIIQLAVHLFDALRFITESEVKKVKSATTHCINSTLENLFQAQIEMTNGPSGIVEASKIAPARVCRYQFLGSDGILQGDLINNSLEFIHGTKTMQLAVGSFPHALIPLLTDWQRFLDGKAANPIPGEDGLVAVQICEACSQSASNDSEFKLEPLNPTKQD